MSDDDKMRERLDAIFPWKHGRDITDEGYSFRIGIDNLDGSDGEALDRRDNALLAWGKSERALERAELLARASEGAAPEFARAEQSLRDHADDVGYDLAIHPANIRALLGELDRRSAKVAAQAAELEDLRKRADVAEHNAKVSNEAACLAASLKLKELAESQPQSADRATRELWMDEYSAEGAIQSLDDTGLLRETREGGCGAGPDGQVAPYRITITAERVEGSE